MRTKPLTLAGLALVSLILVAVSCQPQPLLGPSARLMGSYDVVVVGGEPEGVAAAVASARNGRSTMLLVAETELGGLFTQAMLNFLDLNITPSGELANTGIFAEFFLAIGKKNAFDVSRAKQAFQQLVLGESKLRVRYDRRLLASVGSGQRLVGVQVSSPDGIEEYHGQVLIDATADADLAAMSGVATTFLREDLGQPGVGMGSTLMLHIKQVDWPALRAEAASGRLGYASSTDVVAWGFGRIASLYRPHDPDTFLRGLNIGRQDDGSVLINALVIFGVDPLNTESYQQGLAKGRAEAPFVLDWLRQNLGGFAQAELVAFPEALYVRESRHMIGLYRLTVNDVLENSIFPDAIAFGCYPLDIQAASPDDLGFVVGKPKLYSIPIRCLIPQNLTNLLVVGRSASYDSLAAGSARVVPLGMSVAEAAGVGAAVMLQAGITAQELAQPKFYGQVQERLRAQGVRWPSGGFPSSYPDHPATPALKYLVKLGLISGGYGNSWQLTQTADEHLAARLMAAGMQRMRKDAKPAAVAVYSAGQVNIPLTRDRLQQLAVLALERLPLKNWQPWLVTALGESSGATLSRGELYQFVAKFLEWVKTK